VGQLPPGGEQRREGPSPHSPPHTPHFLTPENTFAKEAKFGVVTLGFARLDLGLLSKKLRFLFVIKKPGKKS
jgi:hypothetical protein